MNIEAEFELYITPNELVMPSTYKHNNPNDSFGLQQHSEVDCKGTNFELHLNHLYSTPELHRSLSYSSKPQCGLFLFELKGRGKFLRENT